MQGGQHTLPLFFLQTAPPQGACPEHRKDDPHAKAPAVPGDGPNVLRVSSHSHSPTH